jgi:hypothetical protein
MDQNAELLNYVYQNAQMGTNTTRQIIDATDDETLKNILQKQLDGYREILTQARHMLDQKGLDEKGLSKMSEVKTQMMVGMETMADKSTPHLAEMMLIGSNMGVVDALKNLRKYPDAASEAQTLMKKLLHFEENRAERFKPLV